MNELLVLAMIAGRRIAFRAVEVQSVIEVGTITPVPRTPDHIAGLTAQRSQALTVFDTRRALGFDPDGYETDVRAAVVASGGHSYALRVDRVDDIVEAVSEPAPIAGGFGDQWAAIAIGMVETGAGPALLLDIDALIEGPQRAAA